MSQLMLQHCVTLKTVAANRLAANSPLKKKKGELGRVNFRKDFWDCP